MPRSRSAIKRSYFKALPNSIWMLGFVSLFTDASSELIHSLLPMFMVSVLGASVTMVGVIEGASEGIALVFKVFSGLVSDAIGRRKWLAVSGYGISAFSKMLFPLVTTISGVFAVRFLDRIGKGVRGAPRDALVSEIAPASLRGASFGLRQSLDTVGAFIGPLLAMALMYAFSNDIYKVLWFAIIPGFISVGILIFGVKEPARKRKVKSKFVGIKIKNVSRLGSLYWKVVAIGLLLTLARFSQAFLLLKAQSGGLAMMLVPLVMIAMNIVYALSSYPAGMLSDNVDRKSVLLMGIGLLVVGDLILGFGDNLWFVFVGAAFWGLHMGFTEGILSAMITDATKRQFRGTAFGFYYFVTGLGMFASSLIAGVLWDRLGSRFTFYAGALFSVLALGAVFLEGFGRSRRRG